MNKFAKSGTVGGVTALSLPGLIETINYLWAFTTLPPLPSATAEMIAGLVAMLIYLVLPQSVRTPPEQKS